MEVTSPSTIRLQRWQTAALGMILFLSLLILTVLDPSQPTPTTPPPSRLRPTVFNITAAVVEYDTPGTLANTLSSYGRRGFLNLFRETFLFIQNKKNPSEQVRLGEQYEFTRILGDGSVTRVDVAWRKIFTEATSKYVLLLEKDFVLVESRERVIEQISAAIDMLDRGVADVVRLRSRRDPGDPDFGKLQYGGHPRDVLVKGQPNLLCNLFNFIEDPDVFWGEKFVRKCRAEPVFYCSPSEWCNWTNNPVLLSPRFWFQYLDQWVDSQNHFAHNEKWVNHNFEHVMNFVPSAWNERNFTIAYGEGLFRHEEIDG